MFFKRVYGKSQVSGFTVRNSGVDLETREDRLELYLGQITLVSVQLMTL